MYITTASCFGGALCAHEPLPQVPERFIVDLWLDEAVRGKTFVSLQGERIRIVSPGAINPYDGPDISGAAIEIDGTQKSGSVEIHRRLEDWFLHRHQENPLYRSVVLHVILYPPDGPVPASMPPTVVLAAGMTPAERRTGTLGRREAASFHACSEGRSRGKAMETAMLVLAAETRFSRKTERISARAVELAGPAGGAEWLQCLYEYLARSLGYGGNADAMQRMAEDIPLALLRSVGASANTSLGIEEVFESVSGTYQWRSKPVRPGNRIGSRLEHLRLLLPALLAPDALDALRAAIEGGTNAADVLETWAPGAAARIGRDRAYEIAVNVFAPWAAAYAGFAGNPALQKAAARLYFHSPFAPQNKHTRAWFAHFGAPPDCTSGIQQGIVEMRTELCANKACAFCLLAPGPLPAAGKIGGK